METKAAAAAAVGTWSSGENRYNPVLQAYRHLFQNAHVIECDRIRVLEENQSLRKLIEEKYCEHSVEMLKKEKINSDNKKKTDTTLELIKCSYYSLEVQSNLQAEVQLSIDVALKAQHEIVNKLNFDTKSNSSSISTLQELISEVQLEIQSKDRDIELLEDKRLLFQRKRDELREETKKEIKSLTEKVKVSEHAAQKTVQRMEGLQNYLQLLYTVNLELVETIEAKKDARVAVRRVAVPVPAQQKQNSLYKEALDLIADAAAASVLQHRATEMASHTRSVLYRTLLTKQQQAHKMSRGRITVNGRSSNAQAGYLRPKTF